MSGRGGHPRYSRGGGHGPGQMSLAKPFIRRFSHALGAHCNCHSHQHRHERQETQQQYKERLERTRKANEEARQRRAEEERLRKERQQRERETGQCDLVAGVFVHWIEPFIHLTGAQFTTEMREAHERQKKKQEDKIAKAEVQRKKAEEAKRAQNQKSQKLRSQVFRAARDGNSAKAKELIWEHSIDATGGEVKAGCEEYVQCKPKDLSETLLHIAVKQDNLDLVEWLTTHGKFGFLSRICMSSSHSMTGADLEERNSQGLTGLHLALKLGRISIVKHIVEAYPPGDSRGIYETPKGVTLLSLAIESKEPELVWVVLENKLASPQDISKAWQKATSVSSQPKAESTKRSDIIELLKTYGGLTPPATPHKTKDSSKPFNDTKHEHDGVQARGQAANSNSQPASKRNANTDLPPGPTPSVAQPQAPKANQQQQKPQGSRGRGNGRGRGRGRGRGNSGKA